MDVPEKNVTYEFFFVSPPVSCMSYLDDVPNIMGQN